MYCVQHLVQAWLTCSCYRERVDLISLQQSERFNDLDAITRGIMEAVLGSRDDIMNRLSMVQAPAGDIDVDKGNLHFFSLRPLSLKEGCGT